MRMLFVASAIGALSLAACASGQTDRQEMVDAGELTGTTSDGATVRCENVRETGSRMSTRICLTQAEWDQMEENAQQLRRDRDAQGGVNLPSQSGGPG